PHALAAASFEPIANTRLPNTVFLNTKAIRIASATVIHTPAATNNQLGVGKVTANWLTHVAGALTVCSPATHFAVPRPIPSIPRVTIKGTTRNRVIANPFSPPINPPISVPAATASSGDHPSLIPSAVITLES